MKIFINYRREDEADIAFAIANSLMEKFGVRNIFFDRQAIQAGSEFPQEIDKAIEDCHIFIPVIGKEWLSIMKKRQAFEEKDYVLSEIENALKKEVLILPVLVDDTSMPPEKDLPPKLRKLSLISAVSISSDPKRLPVDIKLLIAELNDLFRRSLSRPARVTMVNRTRNYYIELKADMDPTLDRLENFGKLKMASAKYSQLSGTDVKLKLVREALEIFGNEENYKVYRKDYSTLALETSIRGATEKNKFQNFNMKN